MYLDLNTKKKKNCINNTVIYGTKQKVYAAIINSLVWINKIENYNAI